MGIWEKFSGRISEKPGAEIEDHPDQGLFTRRQFLKTFIGGSAGAIVGSNTPLNFLANQAEALQASEMEQLQLLHEQVLYEKGGLLAHAREVMIRQNGLNACGPCALAMMLNYIKGMNPSLNSIAPYTEDSVISALQGRVLIQELNGQNTPLRSTAAYSSSVGMYPQAVAQSFEHLATLGPNLQRVFPVTSRQQYLAGVSFESPLDNSNTTRGTQRQLRSLRENRYLDYGDNTGNIHVLHTTAHGGHFNVVIGNIWAAVVNGRETLLTDGVILCSKGWTGAQGVEALEHARKLDGQDPDWIGMIATGHEPALLSGNPRNSAAVQYTTTEGEVKNAIDIVAAIKTSCNAGSYPMVVSTGCSIPDYSAVSAAHSRSNTTAMLGLVSYGVNWDWR